MAVADYIGRTFDLLALRGATPVGSTQLSQTLFDAKNGGEICTGIQKLAQRWVVHFFTIEGSMPFLPDRGNLFLQTARRGHFRTEADVVAAFNIAAVSLHDELISEETTDMPDDERYDGVQLQSISLDSGQLILLVNIFSRAGSSRKVILPVNLLPVQLAL